MNYEGVLRNMKGSLRPGFGCHGVGGRRAGRNRSGVEGYCQCASNPYDAHVKATRRIKREVAHEEIYRAIRAGGQGGADGV
jgi:hypothetical protein